MNKPASELIALADRGRRHAAQLTARLDDLHWPGSRAHIEQARNTIQAMEAALRTAANQSGSERAGVDAYPRWRHRKRGTTYAEIGKAAAETSHGDVVAVLRKCRDYIASDLRMSRDEDEKARRDNLIEEATAAIDRLDVKAEAKSQEPVAVKPLPSELLLYGLADAIGLSATIRRLGGGTIKHEFDRGGIKQLIDALRIRSALIHPTTKPEAPAVSVDAIARVIDPEAHFKDYEGIKWSRFDIERRNLALAKATAIAALIAGER